MADEQNPNNQIPLGGDGGGLLGPGAANIQPINIEEEMRRSYLDYSMSVIIGRALPDIRDGLKPCIGASCTRCTTWACCTIRST